MVSMKIITNSFLKTEITDALEGVKVTDMLWVGDTNVDVEGDSELAPEQFQGQQQ
jgi:hypothetical protein